VEMKPSEAEKTPRDDLYGIRLLTIPQSARYLGIGVQTLYNRIAPGARDPFPIKPKRIGRLTRFDIGDLDRYIDGL
jgi:predicted DNA-binding transcriptional regulator AlpA